MNSSLRLPRCFCDLQVAAALASAFLFATPQFVHAADGTWTQLTSGGLWSNAGNWSGGTIADGSGFTADFNTLNITADNTVHLDSARTIGNLVFGDITTASNGWILDNNANAANILTLAGGTPTITVNALGAGKSALISAVIDGTAGLTKAGTGTLILTGANTYTGTTTINNVAGNRLQIGNGGTTGSIASASVVTNATGSGDGLLFNRSTTYTYSGAISGAGRMSINGTGVIVLSGNNSGYTGITSVGVGSTVQGFDSTAYSGNATTTAVFGTGAVVFSLGSNSSFQFRANGQNDGTAQTLTMTTKNFQLSGASNWTLNVDVDRASGTGTGKTIAAGGFATSISTLNGSITFNITGGNSYVAQFPSLSMGGSVAGTWILNPTSASMNLGAVTNGGAAVMVKTLQLGGTASGNNLTGIISDGTAGAQTAVTKSNSSTWTLGGANTYTGATLISSGTLVLNATGTLGNTGITISGGTLQIGANNRINDAATLTMSGGTFNAQTFTETLGVLTLSGNSFFNLGSGAAISFANSSSATWGSFTLDLTGFVSGSTLRFGVDNTGLTAGQLGKFTATGYSSFSLDSGGWLTAVPEPSTWALLAFSLMTVVILRRRRKA